MNLSTIFDQKTVVGLLCLIIITTMVFAGKTDSATAVNFIKWLAASYFGASAITTASQAFSISKMPVQVGTPEHKALLAALGVKVEK